MEKNCGNCACSNYSAETGYVCANEESENYTDFVDYNHVCEDYEEK